MIYVQRKILVREERTPKDEVLNNREKESVKSRR